MRIVVVGAGVGGLAAAARLAHEGHAVTVLEAGVAAGGKAGRWESGGFRFDTGPSLLTMPHVFEELFADTGAPLDVELARVEPVTRYRFADGSSVELSADVPRAVLRSRRGRRVPAPTGSASWHLRRDVARIGAVSHRPAAVAAADARRRRAGAGSPRLVARAPVAHASHARARARARPATAHDHRALRDLCRADPRRAPAALAVAGWVEHAFGAWHVRGGIYRLVEALKLRVRALGADVRFGARVDALLLDGARVAGVSTAKGHVPADAVVWSGDALVLDRLLGRPTQPARERSLSGFALMLGLRGNTDGLVHHAITFPADYDAEFDDVFAARRLVRDPTVYVSASCATDPSAAPAGAENWFVLVNAPAVLRSPRRTRTSSSSSRGWGSARGSSSPHGARRLTSSFRRARSAGRSTASRRTGGSARCGDRGRSCAACAGCTARAGRHTRAAACRWWRSAAASLPS